MNINRGRQIVYIEPLCLTVTRSAADASPCARGSNYPQNLYPGPQKHLINPRKATDSVLSAVSLCKHLQPPCLLGLQHGNNICSNLEQLFSFPWVILTGSTPHLVTHSRRTVSELVNFGVESAAVLQTGTTNSLLKNFEQGTKNNS